MQKMGITTPAKCAAAYTVLAVVSFFVMVTFNIMHQGTAWNAPDGAPKDETEYLLIQLWALWGVFGTAFAWAAAIAIESMRKKP